jgi:hypothetical protein
VTKEITEIFRILATHCATCVIARYWCFLEKNYTKRKKMKWLIFNVHYSFVIAQWQCIFCSFLPMWRWVTKKKGNWIHMWLSSSILTKLTINLLFFFHTRKCLVIRTCVFRILFMLYIYKDWSYSFFFKLTKRKIKKAFSEKNQRQQQYYVSIHCHSFFLCVYGSAMAIVCFFKLFL